MPNHVSQILKVEGPNAFERMSAYFTDFDVKSEFVEGKRERWRGFDFGKIIHRPAIVDQVVENGADRYIPFLMNLDGAYLLWGQLRANQWPQLQARPLPPWQGFTSMRDGWMEKHLRHTFGDEPIDNALLMIRCFAETGAKGWYEWSVRNWGTKWGPYCSDTDPQGEGDACRIKFRTAWNCAEPVLQKLAELNPDLTFHLAAFNEHTEWYVTGRGLNGRFDLTEHRYPFAHVPGAADDFFEVYGRSLEDYEREISE